jgi:hypothetical protein
MPAQAGIQILPFAYPLGNLARNGVQSRDYLFLEFQQNSKANPA